MPVKTSKLNNINWYLINAFKDWLGYTNSFNDLFSIAYAWIPGELFCNSNRKKTYSKPMNIQDTVALKKEN